MEIDEANKLPLKRVELSLSKFNEVAIPHHLDLLRQHRINIIKHERAGRWARARGEQAAARRAAGRLRALLAELGELRARVRAADLRAFDAAAARAAADTLRALDDYRGEVEISCKTLEAGGGSGALRIVDSSPTWEGAAGSVTSSESVGLVPPELELDDRIQLRLDEQEPSLAEREASLAGWRALQAELGELHAAWSALHDAAHAQRELVAAAADSTEVAAENVEAARAHLSAGERVRAGAWAVGGAAAGLAAGGPVGLLAGAKAGAAAALGGALLAALGARALARRAPPAPAPGGRDEGD